MINFRKQNIFGNTQYVDKQHNIVASKLDDKWYLQKDGKMKFTAGLVNINCGVDILYNEDRYEECLNMVGFFRSDPDKFEFELSDRTTTSYLSITSEGKYYLVTEYYMNSSSFHETYETDDFDKLIDHIILLEDRLNIELYDTIAICEPVNIQAASSKDFVKNRLVRVKSSNVWAYGMDIQKHGDKTGTVYVQFKDKNGNAGDAYAYYNVPVKVWSRGITAPSKGHWVHKYLRDNYPYRKLTGDKKGKLPNAIN